jgi:hypothetical protein
VAPELNSNSVNIFRITWQLIHKAIHWEPSLCKSFISSFQKIKGLEVEIVVIHFNTNLVLNKCSASAQVMV